MSDLTPEQIAAAALLAHTKQVTRERVVSHMSGVGASIVNRYPMAEVQSWTIQRQEADRVLLTGETATLSMSIGALHAVAPFLVAVCEAQHGAATTSERAAQLWAKAGQVKANADAWAGLSAYVNGLRARMEDQMETAASVEEVFTIESSTQTELAAFREANGV